MNTNLIRLTRTFKQLPIIISMHEHNKYYISSNTTYYYGDSLLELSNLNLKSLMEKILSKTNCKEILIELRKIRCTSLYFNLCRRSIIEYCENLFPNNYIDLDRLDYASLSSLVKEMFSYLLKWQQDIISFYSILIDSKQYKGLKYKEELNVLKPNMNIPTFITPPQYSIKSSNGKITFETIIFSIEDFFYYELINYLKNPFKVIKCHECNKYSKVTRYSSLYCSKECLDRHTIDRLNQNLFNRKYLNKIKYLSKLLNYGQIQHKSYELAQQNCRKLYDKFKNKPITEDNLKAFQNQLKKYK